MRTTYSFEKANGTYLSPVYNVTTLNEVGNNIITFEFYDDEALTIPSVGVTGTLTVNGKMSANSVWQNIPNSASPSTVDCSNPLSVGFNGIVNQLQVITDTLENTGYVNIILDVVKST